MLAAHCSFNSSIKLSLIDFVARGTPCNVHYEMYRFDNFSAFCMAKIIHSLKSKDQKKYTFLLKIIVRKIIRMMMMMMIFAYSSTCYLFYASFIPTSHVTVIMKRATRNTPLQLTLMNKNIPLFGIARTCQIIFTTAHPFHHTHNPRGRVIRKFFRLPQCRHN